MFCWARFLSAGCSWPRSSFTIFWSWDMKSSVGRATVGHVMGSGMSRTGALPAITKVYGLTTGSCTEGKGLGDVAGLGTTEVEILAIR